MWEDHSGETVRPERRLLTPMSVQAKAGSEVLKEDQVFGC
jgi:hypothetical protein